MPQEIAERRAAPAREEAPLQDPPVSLAGRPLGRKAVVTLAVVAGLEAVGLGALLLIRQSGHAEVRGGLSAGDASTRAEEDLESFLKVGRAVLEVGEIKVPIASSQPRAPRSISSTFNLVITEQLSEKLAAAGGGGKGQSPQREVLVLNIRSILRGMMDAEGIRLIEPAAKSAFERQVRDRLNQVQIDGDEEKAQVLKVLRGQVLQVLIDKFDSHNY